MSINHRKIFTIILVFIVSSKCFSQDFMLNTLKDELNYQTEKLKSEKNPPYFIQLNVSDINAYEIKCSFGSLNASINNHFRLFIPNIRIGDYKRDNTHTKDNNIYGQSFLSNGIPETISVEDSIYSISKIIRNSIKKNYDSVLEIYKINNKNTNEESNVSTRNDFSKESANIYYENPVIDSTFDVKKWETKLKEISDIFKNESYLESADVEFTFSNSRNYILNNEGSSIVQNVLRTQLIFVLTVKCDDKSLAPIIKPIYAFTPKDLPSTEELKTIAKELIVLAQKLKTANSVDAYSGPCILSPSAAGVFFHEIFGHRVEGHRLNSKTDAQTFKERIGDNILPDFLSINFDPTIVKFNNIDLFGNYKYDDQAVLSKKVEIVKNGKLVNFLMCRTPIDSIPNSNGHGRNSFGAPVVARQSNMFVESEKKLNDEQLKDQLRKICKKKKLEYGFYFKEVTGGFTTSSVFTPNVFNVVPTEVYKIYVDGSKDELVKGVSLIGTPLNMFSEIINTGSEYSVFNGFCFAESGAVPVSTISPAILVNKIETQKMFELKNKKTHLERPDLIK